jgi:hypothetical protein
VVMVEVRCDLRGGLGMFGVAEMKGDLVRPRPIADAEERNLVVEATFAGAKNPVVEVEMEECLAVGVALTLLENRG